MNPQAIAALAVALLGAGGLGGAIVAYLNGIFAKPRTAAEADKLDSDALNEFVRGAVKEILARQDQEILTLRERVIALEQDLRGARTDVAKLRRELDRAGRREDADQLELRKLRAEVEELRRENADLRSELQVLRERVSRDEPAE